MRLPQLGERKRPQRDPTPRDRERLLAEQLVREIHKAVRNVVNINEDMSCSRLRSFLGG